MSSPAQLDILAIAAHRDDVEQTCGGTLMAMHARGWTTGILDLTQGESGTRGTAADREAEANAAARILNVAHREALDLPDGNIENTLANRLKLAAVLRRLRPRVVILPYWQGRHPDHYTSATLGYEACFVSGLAKVVTPGAPTRRIGPTRSSTLASTPTCAPPSSSTSRPLPSSACSLCWPTARNTARSLKALASSSPRRRFASEPSPPPATTACWLESATPSLLFRRK
ncbi:PIG-L family deacetylase [Tunturiibacter empetritectus]|uniref:PIG-L family deacetylase n=1 Tax=Tunturiibacter empetritectus TaxID=3069691 RepID=UPI003D9BC812